MVQWALKMNCLFVRYSSDTRMLDPIPNISHKACIWLLLFPTLASPLEQPPPRCQIIYYYVFLHNQTQDLNLSSSNTSANLHIYICLSNVVWLSIICPLLLLLRQINNNLFFFLDGRLYYIIFVLFSALRGARSACLYL